MELSRLYLPGLLLALMLPLHAQADVANGAKLHGQHCAACHTSMVGGDGSGLYTRTNRRVNSIAALGTQVRRCRDNLGLTWFDDQVQDVVDHLNAKYYKLPR